MSQPQESTQLATTQAKPATEQDKEARKRELVHMQYAYMNASASLPKHIKSPAHLRMAYELLAPLKLNVAGNLRNIWLNANSGTMELCNDAPLAACQMRRDDYVSTVEYHVNAENERRGPQNFVGFKVEGAVCVAKRKGRDDAIGLYTLEQARVAGLTGKDNWRKHPEAMLTKRARAIALRNQWSDVLQGVGIYEADDYVRAPSAGLRDTDLAQSMLAQRPAAPPVHVVDAEHEDDERHDEAAAPTQPLPFQQADDELDALFGADDEQAEVRQPGD